MELLVAMAMLLRLSVAHKGGSVCVRAGARSCAECIQVSESCAWCSDEYFQYWVRNGPTSSRCDDPLSLKKRHCSPQKIHNPRGTVSINENRAISNSTEHLRTQIQPQRLTLALRPGELQTFSLKVKLVEDFPMDLYFLMDLSFSMKEDLENLKDLGGLLVSEIRGISSNVRMGLGSIVKTTSSFSFRNILNLTDNSYEFQRRLSQQQISAEPGPGAGPEPGARPEPGPGPEGGLHAIMQAAVCEEQIGWRNAARFLVFATNKVFSFTEDRTLQTYELCLLQNHTYTHNRQVSQTEFQLTRTLSKHNIHSVFAVTESVLTAYKGLVERLPKAAVGTLSSSSSDVLKLITDTYNSLSSEVILEHSRLPEGVSFSYTSVCEHRAQGTCSHISTGHEVLFEVSMAVQKCPEAGKEEVIKIQPLGFDEEVEVVLNFICECQCSAQGVPQSDKCNGHGTSECGACRCDPGRVGAQCECSVDEVHTEDIYSSCRKDQDSDICSNNGDCVCGVCECKKRDNPHEVYSGSFCQCDNFNCDRSNNKLCGGHGRCECRKCICDANYTGSACDCSLDTSDCLARNGQLCNGRGVCECGVCKCTDPKFQGPTCELCPTCPGVCGQHRDCVECRTFGSGPRAGSCSSDCSYFTVTKVKTVSDLPQPFDDSAPISHCRERDANDCWWYFTYSYQQGAHLVHAAETRDCPSPWL